jgi:hypothetical protein
LSKVARQVPQTHSATMADMVCRASADPVGPGKSEFNLGTARSSAFAAVAVTVLLALPGCVTAKKYRLTNPASPAAQPLQLSVTSAPIEVTLATVLVFKGPGSWKQEARWDEYQLPLASHDVEPLSTDSAGLIDLQGQMNSPDDDPLETREDQPFQLG